MNTIQTLFRCLHVLSMAKMHLFLLHLVQSKYAKIQLQEIPSIGLNLLEFFCAALYAQFLSDIYKKFQVIDAYMIQM